LIIGGLAFVLYFQLVPHAQPVAAATAAVQDQPRRTPPSPPKTQQAAKKFGEYPCQSDCAEDKAGYQWAARNRISDPDDCSGSTATFIEGCRVYAQEQAAVTSAD
jgi:hypothetical protein